MSDDVRDEPLPVSSDSLTRRGGRTTSLVRARSTRRAAVARDRRRRGGVRVAGVGRARASGGAPAAANAATAAARLPRTGARLPRSSHAFDTLAILGEQIVPGSRAAKVPEFLDRLLAVESTDTQKRFTQALGAFEREAREAHGKPWKALTAAEATALLTKMSEAPDSEATRRAFDDDQGRRRRDLLLDRGRHERTGLERQRDVRVRRLPAARRLRLASS